MGSLFTFSAGFQRPKIRLRPSLFSANRRVSDRVILMGQLFFSAISLLAMLSPPFLLGFAWCRLLRRKESPQLSRSRVILAWGAVLFVSGLLIAFIVEFLGYRCNADLGDWSCVIRWRAFAGFMVRITPLAILLAFLGRKGTRIPTALAALAIAYDCVLVDMMA